MTNNEIIKLLKGKGIGKSAIYAVLDWPEEAKTDSDWIIRKQYYIKHGFDEDAKKDSSWEVRASYYVQHGYDEDTKKDPSYEIAFYFSTYLKAKEEIEKLKNRNA